MIQTTREKNHLARPDPSEYVHAMHVSQSAQLVSRAKRSSCIQCTNALHTMWRPAMMEKMMHPPAPGQALRPAVESKMRCIRGHVDMTTWSQVKGQSSLHREMMKRGICGPLPNPELSCQKGFVNIDYSILLNGNSSHRDIVKQRLGSITF